MGRHANANLPSRIPSGPPSARHARTRPIFPRLSIGESGSNGIPDGNSNSWMITLLSSSPVDRLFILIRYVVCPGKKTQPPRWSGKGANGRQKHHHPKSGMRRAVLCLVLQRRPIQRSRRGEALLETKRCERSGRASRSLGFGRGCDRLPAGFEEGQRLACAQCWLPGAGAGRIPSTGDERDFIISPHAWLDTMYCTQHQPSSCRYPQGAGASGRRKRTGRPF